jgi:Na+/H+-dicarboxylate symporter
LIGIAISVIFNILLFNFIDPEAAVTLKEMTLESTAEMMKNFGAPTSEIKKAVEKLEDYDQFSTLEQLKGSIWSIVGSAIFGLILAAIFKKDKPVF